MTTSNTTKNALALSLKSLMNEKTFEKISISDICDGCGMNRKSFYYHFKDKYDLVNWIFDTEVSWTKHNANNDDVWNLIERICSYLEENRSFYRKALRIKGQNSFSDHFRKTIVSWIGDRIAEILGVDVIHEFQRNFFADAFTVTLYRWIVDYTDMSSKEFLEQLNLSLKYISIRYGDINQR